MYYSYAALTLLLYSVVVVVASSSPHSSSVSIFGSRGGDLGRNDNDDGAVKMGTTLGNFEFSSTSLLTIIKTNLGS